MCESNLELNSEAFLIHFFTKGNLLKYKLAGFTILPKDKQKKFLNSADKKLRGARKDMDIVVKEESNSNKIRRQETADSDECTEVQKSKQN